KRRSSGPTSSPSHSAALPARSVTPSGVRSCTKSPTAHGPPSPSSRVLLLSEPKGSPHGYGRFSSPRSTNRRSSDVRRRAPFARAYASASNQFTPTTGWFGTSRCARSLFADTSSHDTAPLSRHARPASLHPSLP